jgi:toxin HigB-1
MIKSFRHKGLADFFFDGSLKGIQPKHAKKLSVILDCLNMAEKVQDINFEGSNLHSLKGRLENLWLVKVSGNWRVTLRFENGDVYIIDYWDYH